jgi:hypothetical protein
MVHDEEQSPATTALASPAEAADAPSGGPARRRWWLLGVAAAAGVLVAAISVSIGSRASAETAVTTAATTALQQKTGQLSLDGSISVAGVKLGISGNGQFDLASGSAAMQLATMGQASLSDLVLSTVVVGGTAYAGGSILQGRLVDGKSWIGLPYRAAASSSPLGGSEAAGSLSSPVGLLATLSQHGSSVTELGGGTVGGVAVTRYKVVPSTSELTKQLEQSQLPASVKQQATALLSQGGITFVVSLDSSQLIRQLSLDSSNSIMGTTIETHLIETISDWGAPVSITAPAAASVCSASPSTISSCLSIPGLLGAAI